MHPAVKLTEIGKNSYELSRSETVARVQIQLDPAIKSVLLYAKDDLPLGWYSPSFMKKERASVLMVECFSGEEGIAINTIIKIVY